MLNHQNSVDQGYAGFRTGKFVSLFLKRQSRGDASNNYFAEGQSVRSRSDISGMWYAPKLGLVKAPGTL